MHITYIINTRVCWDTHTCHPTVSWMSASFSGRVINIPSTRSCLNHQPLTPQHSLPLSACACVCASVSSQLFPLCWLGEINRSHRDRAFYPINHPENPVGFQLIYLQIKLIVIHYKADVANRTPHRMRPLFQIDKAIDFSQVIPIYFWHFTACRVSAQSQLSKERHAFSWHLLSLWEFNSCGETCPHANVKCDLCSGLCTVPLLKYWVFFLLCNYCWLWPMVLSYWKSIRSEKSIQMRFSCIVRLEMRCSLHHQFNFSDFN